MKRRWNLGSYIPSCSGKWRKTSEIQIKLSNCNKFEGTRSSRQWAGCQCRWGVTCNYKMANGSSKQANCKVYYLYSFKCRSPLLHKTSGPSNDQTNRKGRLASWNTFMRSGSRNQQAWNRQWRSPTRQFVAPQFPSAIAAWAKSAAEAKGQFVCCTLQNTLKYIKVLLSVKHIEVH